MRQMLLVLVVVIGACAQKPTGTVVGSGGVKEEDAGVRDPYKYRARNDQDNRTFIEMLPAKFQDVLTQRYPGYKYLTTCRFEFGKFQFFAVNLVDAFERNQFLLMNSEYKDLMIVVEKDGMLDRFLDANGQEKKDDFVETHCLSGEEIQKKKFQVVSRKRSSHPYILKKNFYSERRSIYVFDPVDSTLKKDTDIEPF